ncbi:MAG TPA: peptidoglycan DD-metalloendopeptidase family protein [Candidatus Binataceae bacterium]|nr:peptidoglycan DD-metalloendopeptidase family protein [Candidatus Binataceae bacterium]
MIVAGFASFGSARIFMTPADSGQQQAANQQLLDAAGHVAPVFADEPEVVKPAPEPIAIALNIDHSSSVQGFLEDAGLSSADAAHWADFFERASDSDTLIQGHCITLYKDPENGSLREIKYNLDDHVALREKTYGDGVLRSSQELITYMIRPVAVAFRLRDGFSHDAARIDLPQPIIATLKNAFQDRASLSALPRGSAIKLIYQEMVSRDGTTTMITGLQAAQIRLPDKTLDAFAFRDANGDAHLYDANGIALGQQELRFPLNFEYISSGFSFHRYHPILHEYRPHYGIDLVARYGTPVKAVADGRIEEAGWCGGLGRCVRIQHEGGLVSIYGHLSEITGGLEPGDAVKVGQVIGRLGTSGLSTGPHLHFGLERNGEYIDPLSQNLGVEHHVSPAMRSLFDHLKQNYLAILSRLPDFGGHFMVAHPILAASSAASSAPAEAVTGPIGSSPAHTSAIAWTQGHVVAARTAAVISGRESITR